MPGRFVPAGSLRLVRCQGREQSGTVEADDAQTWAERRREAATTQAERLAREQAREREQARTLIRRFVTEALSAGLPTEELRAVDAADRRYRTGVRGWLLRRDGRSGIGEDGAFYLLGFPGGAVARLTALLRGVHLEPSEPPLVMGRGGRDGESIPLVDLLDRRLAGRDSSD